MKIENASTFEEILKCHSEIEIIIYSFINNNLKYINTALPLEDQSYKLHSIQKCIKMLSHIDRALIGVICERLNNKDPEILFFSNLLHSGFTSKLSEKQLKMILI